jgi:glycosyltransferase involved in cell wall biosynthesis
VKVGIITRRFWPYCGPLEMEAADVAQAIAQAGHQVEVLTIHWEKGWPSSFRFREIDVTRFSRRLGGPWGMFRYLRDLNAYVHEAQFDQLIIYGLADESWAVLRNFLYTIPLGLRLDRNDWHIFASRRFHFRQRRFLKQLARIWVDDAETSRLLEQAQIPAEILEVVPPCIQIPADFERSSGHKTTLRTSLSDTHPILELEPHYPFVLCASTQGEAGIDTLLSAWKQVLGQHPRARLWILGEGPQQEATWQKVCELQISHSVAMPGQFDQIEELLVAADLYVHATVSDVPCHRLARAMACGACIVALESQFTRHWIEHGRSGILTPNSPQSMADSIVTAINHADRRSSLGSAAQLVGQQFFVDRWVDRFVSLSRTQNLSNERA